MLFVWPSMLSEINIPVLEKAGSTSSAEPDFFQILCLICPIFHQIVTKFTIFYRILPKSNKFHRFIKSYQIFTKCYQILLKILPNLWFTQFCRDLKILVIYVFFSTKSVSPPKKLLFPTLKHITICHELFKRYFNIKDSQN